MPQPRSRVLSAFVLFALLLTTPLSALAALRAQEATPIAGEAAGAPVLLMAAPGMSADLVTTFAAEGALPAFAALLAEGASAEGGLASPFPATPGTSLATLLTGTWPGQHGVVNEVFYRTGSPDFAESVTWDAPGLIDRRRMVRFHEKGHIDSGTREIAGVDSSQSTATHDRSLRNCSMSDAPNTSPLLSAATSVAVEAAAPA